MQLLDRLARVPGVDLLRAAAQLEDLAGVDLDVRALALEARAGLVDEDARVGQRAACPSAPPARISEPPDIAIPKQVVATSGPMKRIAS